MCSEFLLPRWIRRPSSWRGATCAAFRAEARSSQDYTAPRCDDSLQERCVKHLWTCQPLWACVWPRCDIIPRSHINSFHSILSPHPLFISFFFCFPFPPCSVYLHRSGLLVGLVFPTFPAMWNKTGRETREKCDAVKRGWEEGRGDGCKTGCETQEEREPRRSPSREAGSSSSRRSLPPQRGLARRYLTYYFTRAYLKSLLHVISQNGVFFFLHSDESCCWRLLEF